MDVSEPTYREWAHAPSHYFEPGAAYMVTAGTYKKLHHFDTPGKRDFLLTSLFDHAESFGWALEAWAVLANHYHFVAGAPEDATSLSRMLKSLHSKTAIWVNRQDGTPGRKVWFQYRDTCLTFEKGYVARLHYVHTNSVKHGMASNAENYRWCSMNWFSRHATTGFRRTVLSVKCDDINVEDEF